MGLPFRTQTDFLKKYSVILYEAVNQIQPLFYCNSFVYFFSWYFFKLDQMQPDH